MHDERSKIVKNTCEGKGTSKVVKTIGAGRAYPTRELSTKLGAYGYGHKMLLKAEKRGLVDRKSVKNKVFNKLTEDGKKLVKLAREIGV